MITAITFNPALDKTIKVEAINYGEVNRVGRFREDLGGKGINMGRILGGFGVKTSHIVVLGKDNLNSVLEHFEADSMPVDYIAVEGCTRTNIKIVEMNKNQTTDINEAGVEVGDADIKALFDLIDGLATDSDYLVMGGSLAKGMPVNMYGQVASKYKDQCHVVIDADDDFLLEGLKGSPYIIKPNIHELENTIDRELNSEKEIIQAAREIIDTYGVAYVLVSMGKEGALLVTKEKAIRSEAIPTNVVSTVGAGDSMLAGFVFGLEEGMSEDQALAFGSACSTLTITVEGYPRLDLAKARQMAKEALVYELE